MEQTQIISLKDVESSSAIRGQDQIHIKTINLTINAGETVAIVGRADSGKSTLLRCVALLDRPLTGIVAIDNKNMTFLASRELCSARRNIGYLNAKPTLLNTKNLMQNVALPLLAQGYSRIEAHKLALQSLVKVGLEAKANSSPAGLNPQQIVQLELARVLVNAPKILLADEIFSNLDQKATDFILNLLESLRVELNLTMMLTTNDTSIIKNYCSRVIVMHQGKIVEHCATYELFTAPQSETAKDFVRLAAKHELPGLIRKKIQNQPSPQSHSIMRISFRECLALEEILSDMLKVFALRMDIIQAYQEQISDQILNIMIIEIFGAHEIMANAIEFLNQHGLHSEIIGYVPDHT